MWKQTLTSRHHPWPVLSILEADKYVSISIKLNKSEKLFIYTIQWPQTEANTFTNIWIKLCWPLTWQRCCGGMPLCLVMKVELYLPGAVYESNFLLQSHLVPLSSPWYLRPPTDTPVLLQTQGVHASHPLTPEETDDCQYLWQHTNSRIWDLICFLKTVGWSLPQ